MYERSNNKQLPYPENLIAAIGIPNVTIEAIQMAIKSERLDKPDDRYRKCIRWYYEDKLTYDEIAEHLGGMSRTRVGHIVHDSIIAIKRILRARKTHFKSIAGANQYVTDLRLRFSSTEDNGKTYKWRYTKPGGRTVLVAEYDYGTRILTIYGEA